LASNIPHIKVSIECKRSRDSNKRRYSQAPFDDRALEKQSLGPVENKAVGFGLRDNFGVSSAAI